MSIAPDLPVHTEHPSGGPTMTFAYDGDGNRVKKDEGGVVTHYPGRHYESTAGSGSTKYFPSTYDLRLSLRTGFANGQLVSFERSPDYVDYYGRRYVFRDHLGSTSIIVNGKGEKLWEDRCEIAVSPWNYPSMACARAHYARVRKDQTPHLHR